LLFRKNTTLVILIKEVRLDLVVTGENKDVIALLA
jgi:hypothetical protein